MADVKTMLPREAYEGPLSFDESSKHRPKPPRVYESPAFKIKWRLFLFLMVALIVSMLAGISYVATQIAIKQYRIQQLEETTRNLEVQISHAQADNLAVRRDVFFDTGLKGILGLEYPAVMKYVYNTSKPTADKDDLVNRVYGFGNGAIDWQDTLAGF